jgi:drug/metabolite transporter (DMT)-like permease
MISEKLNSKRYQILNMANIIQAIIVILAGISVAIADTLIKKVAINNSFYDTLKNPLMIGIVLLYVLQIVLFAYVFVKGWKLGIVGVMQMVAYSIFVILTGLFIFKETFSIHQYMGIILAISGVVLINL